MRDKEEIGRPREVKEISKVNIVYFPISSSRYRMVVPIYWVLIILPIPSTSVLSPISRGL